jgi:hypothetical protein
VNRRRPEPRPEPATRHGRGESALMPRGYRFHLKVDDLGASAVEEKVAEAVEHLWMRRSRYGA